MRNPRCWPALLALLFGAAAAAQPPTSSTSLEPVQVLLDNRGVPDRFVNPVNPVPVDAQPLEFVNNTGDRTFVVTIPFAISGPELSSAYANAAAGRNGKDVSEILCEAMSEKGCSEKPPAFDKNAVDTLEGLRVVLESVSSAKDADLAKDCMTPQGANATPSNDTDHLRNSSCAAEMLFWTATCEVPIVDLVSFAESGEGEDRIRGTVEEQALPLLNKLFVDEKDTSFEPSCPFAKAEARQQVVLCKLESPKSDECMDRYCKSEDPKKPSSECTDFETQKVEKAKKVTLARTEASAPPVDKYAELQRISGLKARFAAARVAMAKTAIQDAITAKVTKLKTRITPAFTLLETARADLARSAKRARKGPNEGYYQCRLHDVEAAGKLLASYGLDSSVPYSGLPESLTKGGEKLCANMKDGNRDPMVLRTEMERILAERTSEQGIEITDCQTNGTSNTCTATATIPPYQKARFSPSVLRHSPEPRIQFTVSFFGDTEVPANANGFVTRGDAKKEDKKPKSKFGVQVGGDTSTSFNPDKAVSGQLRHSGANGTLAFQYTGPVEASATLQYKKDDFGGLPAAASTQVQASQYQAKVYGPLGVVFQYGKIPFAQPSSGIAINVSGEGMQVITGPTSVAYVVARESDTGAADKQNHDHDVWLVQVKNFPVDIPFFRTFDVFAVYGNDRKDKADPLPNPPPIPQPDTPLIARPFTYTTFGTEARWGTHRFPSLGGSFAAYHSVRNVRSSHGAAPATLAKTVDGRGTVGLARVSWTRLVSSLTEGGLKVRPTFGLTGLFGYGTGDKAETSSVNEGYLGETAGYSNDVLFLSKVANSDVFSKALGNGLSNKRYLGLQYTDSRASLLAWISAHVLNAAEDIASRSTVFSLHNYWFGHEVQGGKWAGTEGDLEFKVETPKNIQWSLGGAYYRRSPAIKLVGLKDDLWSVTAKLSIKLNS